MIQNKQWYHLSSFKLPDLNELWSFVTGGWDSCLEAFWLARRQGRCTSWSFIRVSRPQETATRSNCIRRQTRAAMWCGPEKDIEVPGEVSGFKPIFGVPWLPRFRLKHANYSLEVWLLVFRSFQCKCILEFVTCLMSEFFAWSVRMEQSVYALLRTRDMAIARYKDFNIPTQWLLDTGLVGKVSHWTPRFSLCLSPVRHAAES